MTQQEQDEAIIRLYSIVEKQATQIDHILDQMIILSDAVSKLTDRFIELKKKQNNDTRL